MIGMVKTSIAFAALLCFASLGFADYLSVGKQLVPDVQNLLGDTEDAVIGAYHFDGDQSVNAVESQPFSKAIHFEVKTKPAHPWESQFRGTNSAAIAKGQKLLLIFWARCLDSSDADKLGAMDFGLQKQGGGDGSGGGSFTIGKEWERHTLNLTAGFDYPAQGAELNFHVGAQVQTLEVGGIGVFTGPDDQLAKLSAAPKPAGGDYMDKVRAELKGQPRILSLVGDTETDVIQAYGFDGGTKVVPVEGQPFTKAHRVTIADRPRNVWDIQLRGSNATAIRRGDVLFYTLTARCINAATEQKIGQIGYALQKQGGGDFSGNGGLTVPATWQRFNFWIKADHNYPPRGAELNFMLGGERQTLEIGGLGVFDMGPNADVATLPSTKIDYNYKGRALDAPWRAAADERIEKIRKGDLTISVVDLAGKPVPQASVHIAMKKHAFKFATVISAWYVTRTDVTPEQKLVVPNALKYFNAIGFGNDLKPEPWTGLGWAAQQRAYYSREQTMQALQFMADHHVPVKGHVLVYGSPPEWPREPKEAYLKAIDDHVVDEASATNGKVAWWDVVNEATGNNEAARTFGDDGIIHWFQLARKAAPNAKLFINEAGAEQVQPADRIAFMDRLKYLVAHDCPFDGIGLQTHFSVNSINPPEDLYNILEQYAAFGKQIAATEVDVTAGDSAEQRQVQADYLRDLLTVYFSHPSVTQFIQWGFWEGDHWIPEAALFDKHWNIRPHGQAYLDLVFKKWWSDVKATTDGAGNYMTRGFQGEYDITAEANGKSKTVHTTLPKEGITVTVQID